VTPRADEIAGTPPPAEGAPEPLHGEELIRAVVDVLDRRVRPRVQSHGGDVSLEGISDEGVVSVRFHAACHACPIKPVTLFVTVRSELAKVPGVVDVQGVGIKVPDAARRRLLSLSVGRPREQ
jgi:Fe-S cluster biogenesis protein NfuA